MTKSEVSSNKNNENVSGSESIGFCEKYRVSRKSIGLIYIGFYFFAKIVSG